MKHFKFLYCLLFSTLCIGLPSISNAQWVQGHYIVILPSVVRHAAGTGNSSYFGSAKAGVEADCSGTDAASADISVTFKVTWTWLNYGPSSSLDVTPGATLAGFAGLTGYATSAVGFASNISSANTAADGNPYGAAVTGTVFTIPYGLFTFSSQITATAAVFQPGTASARLLPTGKGKLSRIYNTARYHCDAGSTCFAESDVSFK